MTGYGKNILTEVISVGRAGTLIDWESESENRVYASTYAAENILNWRVERINGRSIPTLVALFEPQGGVGSDGDEFEATAIEQIRVLKLVRSAKGNSESTHFCQMELWQPEAKSERKRSEKVKWKLVETKMPLRLGKPLPLLPFVFHGPQHSRPDVDKLPLDDIIAVNLDHYRLNADYKHGVHYTALPTAWVSGFDKEATLRIGSSTAWVTDNPNAKAGYLEFHRTGSDDV